MKKFLGIGKKSKTTLSKQEQVDQDLLKAIRAQEPSIEVIQSLINQNANVNMELNAKNTLLHHLAPYPEKTQIIDLLLENQANVNAQNNSGDTPIYTALKWGNSNILPSFWRYNPDLNIQNEYGNTCLYIATLTSEVGVMNSLLERGINIDHKNKQGTTCLNSALVNARWAHAESLINQGADVKITDLHDNTFLHTTIQYAPPNIIKLLIDKGIDVNAQNNNGDTALHTKITTLNSFLYNKSTVLNEDFQNFLSFLSLFKETNINLNIKNQNNQTVLNYLCREYHKLNNLPGQVVDNNLLSQFRENIIFFARKASESGEDITEYENSIPELFLDIVSDRGTKSARKVAPTDYVETEIVTSEEQFADQNLDCPVETPMIPYNTSDLSGAAADL